MGFDSQHAVGLGVSGFFKLCGGAFDDLTLDENHVGSGFLVLNETGFVGRDADVLVESTRSVVRIVSGLDITLLAGSNGTFGVVGRCATASGTYVGQFQGLSADVGEDELTCHFATFLFDFTEIVGGVFKLDFRLSNANNACYNR